MAAAIAISTFGFLNLAILAPTRVTWAMAADGLFFRGVARLHPRFGTPTQAILLQAGWAIALVLTGTYAGLIETVVFADWIFFGLTVAAVLVFRFRHGPPPAGAFRVPGGVAIPALFVLASAGVVATVVYANPRAAGFGALLLLLGLPAYRYWSRRAPAAAGDAKIAGARPNRPA